MGVKATVVYDVNTHTTLVLRTLTTSISDRYSVIDTIASFSQHCESLRGAVRSVTDVAAAWGGPPYINYNVVRSRFRAIIVWDEEDAEFDIAYDVQHALTRLQNAVESVADQLVSEAPSALRHVYRHAEFALRGEKPIELPNAPEPARTKSTRPTVQLGPRRSSVADQKKKKSLFGKLGDALKSKSSQTDGETIPSARTKQTPSTDNSSRRAPSGNAALSVALYGSEDSTVDDALGTLQLPEAVFAWADFGGPLPNEAGDLQWLANLLRGEQEQKKRPRPPSIRSSTTPSAGISLSPTPLDSQTPAKAPSESINAKSFPSRDTLALGTTAESSLSNGNLNRRSTSASQSTIATPANLSDVPSTANSTISSTRQAVASESPIVTNSLPPLPQSATSSTGSTNTLRAQYTGIQPSSTPSSILQSPNVPPSTLSGSSAVTQASQVPSVVGAPAAAVARASPPIPPALASQASGADEFDVEGLGGIKDNAIIAAQAPIASVGVSSNNVVSGTSDIDEAIRTSMNTFVATMQSGNFTLALQQVDITLKRLSRLQPRRERETQICAYYMLAQKILIRNATLESELTQMRNGTAEANRHHVESALLTMFLAELKQILPRHRAAAMKVAVEKNLLVGNFGMCARWLRHLLEKAPPAQQAPFAQQLQLCIANGEQNKHMPPTNRLCFVTLKVLSSPYGKCSFCPAVYHPQLAGVVAGQVCPICFSGNIVAAQ